MNNSSASTNNNPDVLLIGAGIMSVTLGTMLKELDPNLTIEIVERLDVAAAESSDAMNNAGTGHAAFCELNYTKQDPKTKEVPVKKAVEIAEMFEESRQFWTYLVKKGVLKKPEDFIRLTPHLSFVWGADNVDFLKKRYTAMTQYALFEDMEYSEDTAKLTEWMPLVMEGRKSGDPVAATRMAIGTDIDFGALTRILLDQFKAMPGVSLHFKHEVSGLKQESDKRWRVKIKDKASGQTREVTAKFVFVGCGGAALTLLQKSGIAEGKGYGGFPVSGQWLVCNNPEIIERHASKVYGKASVGAPPMSVPHLDTRVIGGKKALLFGPYAGFTPKFLKTGSLLDLPLSIKPNNILPMLGVASKEIALTIYLIKQILQTPKARLEALKEYFPEAKMSDWKLEIAGQRVQIIKKDKDRFGKLEFGTEVVSAADGSIAALLGASPGASTTISIMLTLLDKCYKEQMKSPEWQTKLKEMIPSYGKSLGKEPELCREIRAETAKALKLEV